MPTQQISFAQLFFSMNGRITRSTFWLKFYLPLLIITLIAVILDFSLGTYDEDAEIGLFTLLFTLLIIYPSIAVVVKRFHDLGYSGWCYFLLLVPLINIYFTVGIYFFRGTRGPNKYGPDPLEERLNERLETPF